MRALDFFFPLLDLTFITFAHNLCDSAHETGQEKVVDNEVILREDRIGRQLYDQ